MITENDIRKWCAEHDCSFYKVGCPEDWNRKDCFRVGVVGGTAWAEYGVTIPIQLVKEWLKNPPLFYAI